MKDEEVRSVSKGAREDRERVRDRTSEGEKAQITTKVSKSSF